MIWRKEEQIIQYLNVNDIHKQQLFTEKDAKELIKILMMPALKAFNRYIFSESCTYCGITVI